MTEITDSLAGIKTTIDALHVEREKCRDRINEINGELKTIREAAFGTQTGPRKPRSDAGVPRKPRAAKAETAAAVLPTSETSSLPTVGYEIGITNDA